jgi:uncharacterized protein (DUF2384 family)
MTKEVVPANEPLDHRQSAALAALRSNAWAEIVLLEVHVTRETIAKALGYDERSYATRTAHFNQVGLWKLRLLARLVAALSEAEPHHVIGAWLNCPNPPLGELSPVDLLQATKVMSLAVEKQLIDSLKAFLKIE